jgi:hypothetical protein
MAGAEHTRVNSSADAEGVHLSCMVAMGGSVSNI